MLKNWYIRENVKYVSIILVLSLIYSLIFPPLAQANTNDPLTIDTGNEAWGFQGNLPKGSDAKNTIKKDDISSPPLTNSRVGTAHPNWSSDGNKVGTAHPTSLLARYPFQGHARDTSGNGKHGTAHGAVLTADRQDNAGSAYSFDGIDDSIAIPVLNSKEISLCAWFQRQGKGKTNAGVVFCGWDSGKKPREGFGIKLSSKAHNMLEFTVITRNAKGKKTQRTARYRLSKAVVSRWCHVAGTYEMATGNQRLYVNGKLVKTTRHPAGNTIVPLTKYPEMKIGNSGAMGYFNGKIDEVCLYNRTLSDEEVQEIYEGEIVNKAPHVCAGDDQVITFPDTATLNGSVTDDGLPEGCALTITWSKESGPGTVTFADPHQAVTTASFSKPGVYELCLSGSDSELSKHDHIKITVNSHCAHTPTCDIKANPETLVKGEKSTLTWTSTNATSAEIDQGIGAVAVNGSLEVSPQQTTTYTITVKGDGGKASASVTVEVTNPNENYPPKIVSSPFLFAMKGEPYGYDAEARDPDRDDVLTFSLDAAPDGMTIDAGSGLISWTPTQDQIGTNEARVRVQDQEGLFDTQTFAITVASFNVDITISSIDASSLSFDGQALTVSGNITAEITNHGHEGIVVPYDVLFFEDVNFNKSYDAAVDNVLGRTNVTEPLSAAASVTVTAALPGSVRFSGAHIWGYVDSENRIPETDEGNNLLRSSSGCQVVPRVGVIDPVLEWSWTS